MPQLSENTCNDAPPANVCMRTAGHIPAWDGLRGLAILIVMMMHFYQGGGARELLVEQYFWMGTFAEKLFEAGGVGVDLFFVLSGFLITGILLDAKPKTSSGTFTRAAPCASSLFILRPS
jgi:peptidoglycan/LPS O-acetylase OafA/YrhL